MATLNISTSKFNSFVNYGVWVDDVRVESAGTYTGDVFEFRAEVGWLLDRVYVYDPIMEIETNFPITSGGKVCVFPAASFGGIEVRTKADPNVKSMVVTQAFLDQWDGNSVDLWVDGVRVETEGTVYGEDFSFVARGSFFFVSIQGGFNAIMETYGEVDGFSEDMKTAYFTPNVLNWGGDGSQMVMDSEEDIVVLGANDVYVVDDEVVGRVINRSFALAGSDTYSKYILGLIRLPLAIDPELVVGSQEIWLNDMNTGLYGDKLMVDKAIIDLGRIEVEGEHGDFRDFKGVECILHLPFTTPVVVGAEYVIDQVLEVQMQVNLYNGEAVYVINSSYSDGVAGVQKTVLEVDIPFARVSDVPKGSNPTDVKFGLDNGVWTAYVEIKTPESLLMGGLFSTPIPDEGLLAEFDGFVRIQEMEVDAQMTGRERDKLNDLLKKGVFN